MNKKYLDLAENLLILNNEDEKDEFLTKLYMIIHIASGDCENQHEDWKKEIEPLFKSVGME